MNILQLLEMLAKVEKLTDRDKLIMLHAYEIGYREGTQAILKVACKEGANA